MEQTPPCSWILAGQRCVGRRRRGGRDIEAMEPAPEPEPRPSPEEEHEEQEARAEARATLESYGLDGSAGGEEKPTKPKVTLAANDDDALHPGQCTSREE